ncbi:MAG: hypothetical protein H7Y03_09335 [Chitinophagaceae bacterium]|nr:hypothetical protein [Chitinophagaceae bacterium]
MFYSKNTLIYSDFTVFRAFQRLLVRLSFVSRSSFFQSYSNERRTRDLRETNEKLLIDASGSERNANCHSGTGASVCCAYSI